MKELVSSRTSSSKGGVPPLKAAICELLNWDEMQYGQFQYESGLAYLRHYIIGDGWGQDLLQRTKLFWSWWKAQWAIRDRAFLLEQEVELSRLRIETRLSLYRHLHNASILASEIYPGRMIMDESYNQMIHTLINENQHAKAESY